MPLAQVQHAQHKNASITYYLFTAERQWKYDVPASLSQRLWRGLMPSQALVQAEGDGYSSALLVAMHHAPRLTTRGEACLQTVYCKLLRDKTSRLAYNAHCSGLSVLSTVLYARSQHSLTLP